MDLELLQRLKVLALLEMHHAAWPGHVKVPARGEGEAVQDYPGEVRHDDP